ncbi:MAG: ABC transporter substrate-binding protein [Rhodospirillaceae bacterium]
MRPAPWLCLLLWVSFAPAAPAAEVGTIVISAPGPHNLSYLPVDLIPKIGADRDEGARLTILHTGGGAVALNNLTTRNADFAATGVPAAMSLRAGGGDVVVIAPVDDAPLFVLMVRADLAGSVKRIADLRGKVIGVNTSTRASKTTSQQLVELLLASDGVGPDSVRIVPAGQSWVEQSSLLISGAADAVMGDEPFASRLLAEGRVYFLASLAEPDTIKAIRGSGFLLAALATRAEIIATEPAKVAAMTGMLRRSLIWLTSHTPDQVVEALGVTDPGERDSLLAALRKYPRAFSRDGKFSTAQFGETDLFFHAGNPGDPRAQALTIESMVDDRWAGRRP